MATNPFEMIREIDGNDVKLYHERAILSYLDTRENTVNADRVKISLDRNPVPVKDDCNNVIGFASVAVINGKLVADATIDWHTPERLAAELRDGVRHWLRIVGVVNYAYEQFVDLSSREISEVQIDYLVLSTKKPRDARLLPFGEPIL